MKHSIVIFGAVLSASLVFLTQSARADDNKDDQRIRVQLSGFNENVPPPILTNQAISSPASGRFTAKINRRMPSIEYELTYQGFDKTPVPPTTPTAQPPNMVLVAHIHFGQRWQNGGVSVFLCANNPPIANAPAGTQVCPTPAGTITGTITPADVIGPANQLIAPGEFAELLDAIDAGATYVNVHSTFFPAGEIRAQLQVQ